MPDAVTRTLLIAVLAAGCTEIPEPAVREQSRVDAGTNSDAGYGPYTYEGRCTILESASEDTILRNSEVGFLELNSPSAKVNYVLGTVEANDGSRWGFDAYAVGRPVELLNRVLELGVGVNANLIDCVHCLLAYTQCDDSGACAQGPYFATAGVAAVPQMAEAQGESFQMEVGGVEVTPVTIHEDLSITLDPDEPCYFFYSLVVSGKATVSYPCEYGIHCELAATADDRHPPPLPN